MKNKKKSRKKYAKTTKKVDNVFLTVYNVLINDKKGETKQMIDVVKYTAEEEKQGQKLAEIVKSLSVENQKKVYWILKGMSLAQKVV